MALSQNYIKYNLIEQHRNLNKLTKDSLLAYGQIVQYYDDGIPTLRPDLGTTLIPSSFGLELFMQENAHPALKQHLPLEEFPDLIRNWKQEDLLRGEIPLALEYLSGLEDRHNDFRLYVPDTQGVFDLAHLLLGDDIFYVLMDNEKLAVKILDFCREVFIKATMLFKTHLGETAASMFHGHGMLRGIWFPHCGARISEDSCTLLSPSQIEKFCLPQIRKALSPFGTGFLHFCGHRLDFLEMVCRLSEVSVINLGNPEKFVIEDLFRICGTTGTVLFQHFNKNSDENAFDFLDRVAELCSKYHTKCILIYPDPPQDREMQKQIVKYWHKLTASLGM